MTPQYTYNAEFVRAVDGDTVVLIVDLGFNVRVKETFRLLGVDTPERGQEGFKEAKDFVFDKLNHAAIITVETFKNKKGKYGRYLTKIWYDFKCLNQELLDEGLAREYK